MSGGDVALVVLSVFLASFSLVFVAARCAARWGIRKEYGVVDGFVVLALCCAITHAALFIVEFSRDKTNTDGLDVSGLRIVWIANLVANLGLPIAKIAILLTYLDFFIWPKHQSASRILLAGVASYAWDLFTNIAILALPMMAVVRWAQPRGEKLAFTGLYTLGFVAIVMSVIRLWRSDEGDPMSPISDNTALWFGIDTQLNVIIWCASLPSLGALLDRFFPGCLASWSSAPGRRVSHHRAWLKIPGRESPHPPTELRPPTALSRRPSAHSTADSAKSAASDAPSMASVTTNNRGSAHPGALVIIPEDIEDTSKPLPSRSWKRGSRTSRVSKVSKSSKSSRGGNSLV
ncbi:uncharacterized protein AB675_6835 [Cyphellophora attinorum]|uniref:Rhodopsin domain-containing protein n=1 Tax=Cyphellophora attinorum TaxID=1664694 RepID=A0A0N1HUX2_9EURO|nr:uncharacterized protein AB675_6835 [Phialophora attinorum]KPI43343.1 hypothetical protein AB675_6835 [Phialophora attinorum]